MLHRYTVRLYDENPLDAELVDLLADLDGKQRQELLRMLLRIGHKSLHGGMTVEQAMEQSVLSDMTEKMTRLTSVARSNMGSSYSRKNTINQVSNKESVNSGIEDRNTTQEEIKENVAKDYVTLEEITTDQESQVEEIMKPVVEAKPEQYIESLNWSENTDRAGSYPVEETEELVDVDPSIMEMEIDEDEDDEDDDFDGLGSLAKKFS